jgi:hypothetical protein
MELEEARDLLVRLRQDYLEALKAVQEGQATIESTRLILQGLLRRFPDLDTELGDDAPNISEIPEGGIDIGPGTVAQGVRTILQENSGEWYRVSEMVNSLRGRGWLPQSENPANAVRTALERLAASEDSDVQKGRMKRDNAVGYVYDPDYNPEPPPNTSLGSGYGFDEEPF